MSGGTRPDGSAPRLAMDGAGGLTARLPTGGRAVDGARRPARTVAADAHAPDTIGGGAAAGTAHEPGAAAQRFPRPEKVRGLYLNAWAAGSTRRVEALLDIARRTEINAFVIDIKDASGYVSHRTQLPFAREIGATEEVRIPDLAGLLDRLEAEGIYPIARIVIVKDPLIIEARPDLAVQDTAGGVWTDSKGIQWLNPYDSLVWDYHVDLAEEVVEMGFPEIQWDYVRFPDAPLSDLQRATYPGDDGRTKAAVIRDFLDYSREQLDELGAVTTADVFGVTTSAARDVGIGQVWESFIDVVDVALPMVYPSHYWQGSFGIQKPNAYPYEIVKAALTDAIERSAAVEGAGLTRPWLQDFTLGSPAYDAPEVRAQIQATYDAGIGEWILWNPGSHYTEGALAPVDGWQSEPLMRVAGGIHPVSRRQEAIDSVRVATALARARADSIAAVLAQARADSLEAARQRARTDSALARARARADSLAARARAEGDSLWRLPPPADSAKPDSAAAPDSMAAPDTVTVRAPAAARDSVAKVDSAAVLDSAKMPMSLDSAAPPALDSVLRPNLRPLSPSPGAGDSVNQPMRAPSTG